MARSLERPATIADWLAFDDGTDTRYELCQGRLVAMAPASTWHATIAQNVGDVIQAAMSDRPPCRAVQGAGLEVDADGDRRGYVADVAMTCEPPGEDQLFREPKLVVEIFSPSTGAIDKRRKVPDYGRLSSVEEIWLIDSGTRAVLVWRRAERTWVGSLPLTGEDRFASTALGCEVALERLYRNTGL